MSNFKQNMMGIGSKCKHGRLVEPCSCRGHGRQEEADGQLIDAMVRLENKIDQMQATNIGDIMVRVLITCVVTAMCGRALKWIKKEMTNP